jgi:hypothetical protein
MTGSITFAQGRFRVTADWDADLVTFLRRIPGRRAEPGNVWTVPAEYGTLLRQASDLYGLVMDTDLPNSMPVPATVGKRKAAFELRFDYADQRLVGLTSRIPGASWFSPSSCWLVPETEGVAVHLWAEETSATVSDEAEDAIAYSFDALVRYKASAAKTTDWQPKPGMGIDLFDEQRAGVEYVVEHAGGRCIIGDEPGVGKTAQALGTIHHLHAVPAVIIVPASLKVNWRREAKRALPWASVEILRGTRPHPRLLWADITIINYDILPAWMGNLPEEPLAVVADESHWIKNPAIERTRCSIELAEQVPDGLGARLALTGTPLPNRTNEIMTQLEFIGRIDRFGGKYGSRQRWQGKGIDLNKRMRETCYIRRLKKDVWKESPGRNWAELYVEGETAAMAEYRKAEADIVAFLGERARKAAMESGASTEEAQAKAWQAAMRAQAAEHLVAITHLKQLAARAALPALKAWAKDFLDSGEKLTMFGWHRAIVDELTVTFNAVKVQGGMSETERQRSVDLFQTKDEVKVFVGQIKAAGEGLTLTAASNMLLVELPWNQATMDQALDRMHRRGQVNDCVGYIALIEDTITEDILKLIRQKQAEVTAVVDGVIGNESHSILQDLVVLLAQRGMKNGPTQPA